MGIVELGVDVLRLHYYVHENGGDRAGELAVSIEDVLGNLTQTLDHLFTVGSNTALDRVIIPERTGKLVAGCPQSVATAGYTIWWL